MGMRRLLSSRAAGFRAVRSQPATSTPADEQPAATPEQTTAEGDQASPGAEASAAAGPPRPRHRWWRWLLGAAVVCLALFGAAFYYLWHIPLPGPPPLPQASVIYDANGRVLATFSEQNRVNVPLAQVPKVVIDAVVSTEDRHFFTEGAINPLSIVADFAADVTGSRLQGGSPITQQYVKQAYLGSKRTLVRKIKEAALAIRLSHKESK